jgi:serine/threonine-protein phosphatase PPG1
MSDLVWSDPVSDPVLLGINEYKEGTDTPEFAISPRGAGFIFGKEVTKRFLHMNQLDHITRAHQLCMEGYQVIYMLILS